MLTGAAGLSRDPEASMGETVLVLRTCDESMRSRGWFLWPREGPVAAPDWRDDTTPGGGLHGLLWGDGDPGQLSWEPLARWLVVEVAARDIRDIPGAGAVKFPRGVVVHCGDRASATQYLHARATAHPAIVGLIAAGGDAVTLTGGFRAVLTAGDYATLTGGDYATLSVGTHGRATGGQGAMVRGGHHARLVGGDCAFVTGGDGAHLTGGALARLVGGSGGSTFRGGEKTSFTVYRWDDAACRHRTVTAYVGENGITPGVRYRCWGEVWAPVEPQGPRTGA